MLWGINVRSIDIFFIDLDYIHKVTDKFLTSQKFVCLGALSTWNQANHMKIYRLALQKLEC